PRPRRCATWRATVDRRHPSQPTAPGAPSRDPGPAPRTTARAWLRSSKPWRAPASRLRTLCPTRERWGAAPNHPSVRRLRSHLPWTRADRVRQEIERMPFPPRISTPPPALDISELSLEQRKVGWIGPVVRGALGAFGARGLGSRAA